MRLAGVALALSGIVLTYNLASPLSGRVGPFWLRTDLWSLAGPVLLTIGMLMALVTRVSRRRASAPAATAAQAPHWQLKRVV